MEVKRKNGLGKCKLPVSMLLWLIEAGYIAGILAVVIYDRGDCDTPIRLWLYVLVLVFMIHFGLLSFSEILTPHCEKYLRGWIGAFSALVNVLLSLFMIAWFIIGNYWYYTADLDKCEDSFYSGQMATYVILVIYYIFLGLGCCCGCCMLLISWIGNGLTGESPY